MAGFNTALLSGTRHDTGRHEYLHSKRIGRHEPLDMDCSPMSTHVPSCVLVAACPVAGYGEAAAFIMGHACFVYPSSCYLDDGMTAFTPSFARRPCCLPLLSVGRIPSVCSKNGRCYSSPLLHSGRQPLLFFCLYQLTSFTTLEAGYCPSFPGYDGPIEPSLVCPQAPRSSFAMFLAPLLL